MDEAKDEPWGVRTALRQSLHIIDIHRSKRSAEDPNDSNLPPVPTISQNVPKLEPAHSTPDRVFKANPFDARSGEAVYQVEPLDEHLIDRFPLPPRGQILARRKYFFFAIAGFAFLASIAIGLGIGLSKKQSSTPAQYPGLAVSGLFVKNVTQWNMQLFYQERTSSTINYRISTNTIDYSAAQAITLSHAPTQNTPMAATSFDGTTFHNLFYILNSEIVLANMTCPPSSPTSCSTLTNTVMSKGLQNSVAEDSSIAAVFLGFGVNKGFRIFHHNTTHEVIELALMNGTKQETVITDAAVQGSSLAAVTFSTPGYIQVLYMNAKANTIFTVEYFNGNWLARASPSFPSSLTNYVNYSDANNRPHNPISPTNHLPNPLLRLGPRLLLRILHLVHLHHLRIHRPQRLLFHLSCSHFLKSNRKNGSRMG